MRKTADSLLQIRMNAVMEDVIEEFGVPEDKFVFGGFLAGGIIALRYAELCKQYPRTFPVTPAAVFMADSPIDLFHFWNLMEEILTTKHSKISTVEAEMVEKVYRYSAHDIGTVEIESKSPKIHYFWINEYH